MTTEHLSLDRSVELSAAIGERISRARDAQRKWAPSSFAKRRAHIFKMRDYIVANSDYLVETLHQDTAKTRLDALADEVLPCAFACNWYAREAERVLAKRSVKTSIGVMFNKKSQIHRLPLGVVGVISPWNYPLTIPFGEIVMGLMAGNAIILRCSEVTPQVSSAIDAIVAAGELPENLYQRVSGEGAKVVDGFFKHGIDKLFFTGSVQVGKELMRQAAETLTPLSLELGGNDPMLVLDDADLERASNGALWGAFQNGGQTCAGIERLYVDESVYDDFLALVCRKTRALRHGLDVGFNVDIGGITTAKQLAIIRAQVEAALADGAQVAAQSQLVGANSDKLFPATVLVGVNHSMEVMREETFGPVLGIMKVRNEKEAIAMANDSNYALSSSVWTRDNERGKRVAMAVAAGVSTINDHTITHALSETPWGGWKHSGIGRTHGEEGLYEMTHCKVINWDRLPAKRNLFWYPADKEAYVNLQRVVKFSTKTKGYLNDTGKFLSYAAKKMFSSWEVP